MGGIVGALLALPIAAALRMMIEEVRVEPESRFDGALVRDCGLRQELGVIIVAIRRHGGEMTFNPAPEVVMAAGDLLIALGPREKLARLEEIARTRKTPEQ